MASDQVTRCPHCLAVYRVTASQLAQAQGWLRCGQCHEAFDSTGLTVPWQPEADERAQRMDIQDFLQTQDRGATSSLAQENANDALLSFEQALATFPGRPAAQEVSASLPEAVKSPTDQAMVGPAVSPSRRGLRTGMWLFSLLLVLQLGWGLRGWWWQTPWMAAVAQNACVRLGCVVPAWPDPGHLQVESSHFVRAGTGYRLEWALRNASVWPVRMPALELTLTADDDSVLARKVVSLSDMSAPDSLKPAQVWEAVLAVAVPENMPVSGYRLRVFYP